VRFAARRLAQRPESRKVMITLSDGEPYAADNNSILDADLKLAVAQVVAAGIEVVGIGIQTSSVSKYYPDHMKVYNLKDLAPGLFRCLRRYLVAGGTIRIKAARRARRAS